MLLLQVAPDDGELSFYLVYNWAIVAIVYKHQSFLKVVVHVIIIDQCNQTAH